jgi:hypothetical protein
LIAIDFDTFCFSFPLRNKNSFFKNENGRSHLPTLTTFSIKNYKFKRVILKTSPPEKYERGIQAANGYFSLLFIL